MSTLPPWKEFENQVAELYRLMGHKVNQNVGLLGHQIDLILTYAVPGGITTKTAVECKYVKKGNLQKNDVMGNINALTDLKRNNKVQNLVIVTTHGFSKDLWDTAEANNIELLTFRDLQHQIVSFEPYLNFLIEDFENDTLSQYYISLIARKVVESDEIERRRIDLLIEEKAELEKISPEEALERGIFWVEKPFLFMEYITSWLKSEFFNHISILGEYGMGKTSFCRKLSHNLANDYLQDPLNTRIPLLVNLREYSKAISVRQLITDLLINEYGLQGINFRLFKQMNEAGMFVLIFDGFDEMSQKVIFDVAYENFAKIAELAKPAKSKVLVTCRTEFFRSQVKEREILLNFRRQQTSAIVYLQEFTDDQIRKFLQKRVPLLETQYNWEYYYQQIHEIFDLKDLAKRPVLLELITQYLPQLIEHKKSITTTTLYETMIKEELKREIKKGRTIIYLDDRLKLMQLLAWWMAQHNQFSVYFEEISKLLNLQDYFDEKTRQTIDYYLHDFLTCSFLNRDAQGNYHFSHKSFVEYLMAENIVKAKNEERSSLLEEFWALEDNTQKGILNFGTKELYKALIMDKNNIERLNHFVVAAWLQAWANYHILEPSAQIKIPMGVGFGSRYYPGTFIIRHEEEKLVELDLSDCNLYSLPKNLLEMLKDLKVLILRGNKLRSLDESFGQLKNLIILDIADNQLRSLPKSIGQLQSLQKLVLANNELENLPKSIGNLADLEILLLNNNNLQSLPESFGKLTKLKRIWFHENRLRSFPESFEQLKNLKELALTHNEFHILPQSISKLTELELLWLNNNQLISLPESISNLSKLRRLHIAANRLTSLPESFGDLQNLDNLDLKWNKLQFLPQSFEKLVKLEDLELSRNKLKVLSKSVEKLVNLKTLKLWDNQLETIPASFCHLTKLKVLNLGHNLLRDLPEKLGNLSNLSELFLQNNQLRSLPRSFGNLKNLRYLELQNNQLESLPDSFSNLSNLKKILLGNNNLKTLPDSIKKLEQHGCKIQWF